jgi:hypothetical protein
VFLLRDRVFLGSCFCVNFELDPETRNSPRNLLIRTEAGGEGHLLRGVSQLTPERKEKGMKQLRRRAMERCLR